MGAREEAELAGKKKGALTSRSRGRPIPACTTMAATGVPVRLPSGHAGATVADDLTTPKLGGAVTAPLGEPAYHGLHPGDLKAYPLLSLGSGSMPPADPALQVRALRASQFAELYDQYVRCLLYTSPSPRDRG